MGKPAIFIPFPAAAGGHQSENAEALEKAGAAFVKEEKELSSEILAEKIAGLQSNPELLEKMAENSKNLGRPDAAKSIAEDILSWIESRI
jgi:UDP-N-acetylglucosamine--N-acetylmuramyl-(pentapeptide) pyrophosphoryl-undecaprenol N-acetylglucosamine transferase